MRKLINWLKSKWKILISALFIIIKKLLIWMNNNWYSLLWVLMTITLIFTTILDINNIFVLKREPSPYIFFTISNLFLAYGLFWYNEKRVNKYFRTKMITDIIVRACLYFTCSYCNQNSSTINYLILTGLSVYVIIAYINSFRHMAKEPIRKDLIYTCINRLMTIMFYFSILNLAIYYLDNDAYVMDYTNDWFYISFNFLYYTFTNTVTLGSAGVEPVSILAKTLQMLYVGAIYLYVGSIFIKVISSAIDKTYDDQEG